MSKSWDKQSPNLPRWSLGTLRRWNCQKERSKVILTSMMRQRLKRRMKSKRWNWRRHKSCLTMRSQKLARQRPNGRFEPSKARRSRTIRANWRRPRTVLWKNHKPNKASLTEFQAKARLNCPRTRFVALTSSSNIKCSKKSWTSKGLMPSAKLWWLFRKPCMKSSLKFRLRSRNKDKRWAKPKIIALVLKTWPWTSCRTRASPRLIQRLWKRNHKWPRLGSTRNHSYLKYRIETVSHSLRGRRTFIWPRYRGICSFRSSSIRRVGSAWALMPSTKCHHTLSTVMMRESVSQLNARWKARCNRKFTHAA